MQLPPLSISKIIIPEFNGNKKLPVNEQVKIFLSRIPGTTEKSTYQNIKSDAKGSIEFSYNDQLLISAIVERVENLSNGDEKILNGRDLAAANHPFLEPLLTEIREHVFPSRDKLTQGESIA